MSAPRRRVFVGLGLAPALAQRVEAAAQPALGAGLRRYPARDLHLTLDFLGVVAEDELDAWRAAWRARFAAEAPGELRLGAAGVFPDAPARPRVFWQGLDAASVARTYAWHAAARAGRGAAADPRASWRPHLTLARARREAGARELAAAREALARVAPVGVWRVDAATLYESRPEHPEARYRALEAFPLGAAGGVDAGAEMR